jgi:two-component system response regulator YesN
MFQVLLVDDDPLVHHDLRTLLDWSKHGFELCSEAYNGAMALEMIKKTLPHIAIIDVDMPGMNGVELNREIRDRYPSIKTFMLSSYDDYDYVRECLNNGAVDYLLKHRLNDAALISILNKATLELQQDNPIQEDHIAHREMAEKMNAESIRDRIADMVRGKSEAIKELAAYASGNSLYPDAVSYVAAAVQIIPFLLLTDSYSDVQTNKLVQQAVEIIQQSLGDIRERTVTYVEDGRLIIVFSFKERSEHAAASEVGRQMSKLQHSLELFLNLKCIYAIGHACGNLSQLGTSYDSAERELDRTGGRRAGLSDESASLTIEEQKQLLLAIERLDLEVMQQLIAAVFAVLHNQPVHSHKVQIIVGELLKLSDKALRTGMPTPSFKATMGELPSRSDLSRVGSIGELEQWLQSYYAKLLISLKQQRVNGRYSRHVSQVIQFVLERYQDGITLDMAAKEINLNPSYLSRIFKEETHSTFSEYLNQIRIEAGRKLLESGQYSIKQISSQVGFSTYNYFFKVFKETTGMTPHVYANSLGRG